MNTRFVFINKFINIFKTIKFIGEIIISPLIIIFIFIVAISSKKSNNPKLFWGPVPIMNNKYWSLALAQKGFISKTVMLEYFSSINRREDFDIIVTEIITNFWLPIRLILRFLLPFICFIYALWNFDIFHHPFSGGFLGNTCLWRWEAFFLKVARKKVVIIPYGADAYLYSQVIDPLLRHALLLSYPNAAKEETKIQKRVNYWTKNADAIIAGIMIDGISRWDVLCFSVLSIDTKLWQQRAKYSQNNGINGVVKVIHTPNHRGFKGTEFLIQAIKELQEEGLKVELILIEKKQNEEVRLLMAEEADILAEQFIATAYALSAIEGMASGLPVLSNLEHEAYTRMFRRYSYLNECPILSTTPETIKNNLRILITNPKLREELGIAGRLYVEKYHSEVTTQYMFESIYQKIWFNKEVDLMNLFHPLKSEYNKTKPFVKHPLVENCLPLHYLHEIINLDESNRN
ncbi:MAG: hypothetical protein RLZZ507_1973 [Cyanobacteriota bacterium]|jgi:glycosyltransferase involved in cell wall biosynthesis